MTRTSFIGSGMLSVLLCAAAPTAAENRLVAKVAAAVKHNRLAPTTCLQYTAVPGSTADDDVVRVSRQHGGTCGGDPSVDEHLFDVHVDRPTGTMTTNARDPEGLEETPLAP